MNIRTAYVEDKFAVKEWFAGKVISEVIGSIEIHGTLLASDLFGILIVADPEFTELVTGCRRSHRVTCNGGERNIVVIVDKCDKRLVKRVMALRSNGVYCSSNELEGYSLVIAEAQRKLSSLSSHSIYM